MQQSISILMSAFRAFERYYEQKKKIRFSELKRSGVSLELSRTPQYKDHHHRRLKKLIKRKLLVHLLLQILLLQAIITIYNIP